MVEKTIEFLKFIEFINFYVLLKIIIEVLENEHRPSEGQWT